MLIESIKHNLDSSKFVNTPYSPAIKQPSKGYIRSDLQQAWINTIRKYGDYHWFVTLTFRSDIHPDQADKRFHIWIRHINTLLYGGNYRTKKKGVTWVRAMEYQKRGVLHFHCLVGSPELYKLKRLDCMKLWETNCGRKASRFTPDPNRFDRVLAEPSKLDCLSNGFARIYKYDSSQGADIYCSKYVTKGADNIDMYVAPPLWNLVNNKDQGGLQFTID